MHLSCTSSNRLLASATFTQNTLFRKAERNTKTKLGTYIHKCRQYTTGFHKKDFEVNSMEMNLLALAFGRSLPIAPRWRRFLARSMSSALKIAATFPSILVVSWLSSPAVSIVSSDGSVAEIASHQIWVSKESNSKFKISSNISLSKNAEGTHLVTLTTLLQLRLQFHLPMIVEKQIETVSGDSSS